MKILIKVLFLIFICNSSIAQQDTIVILYPKNPELMDVRENDTLFIQSPMDGQILFGTMALPTTSNQVGLYGAGLWLETVVGSDCNNNAERESFPDKINSIWKNDSVWVISTQITSNCCHKFLGDASMINDSIINLIYIGYGGHCACDCCFGLTYTFEKQDYESESIMKWIMINGDEKTLFRIKN